MAAGARDEQISHAQGHVFAYLLSTLREAEFIAISFENCEINRPNRANFDGPISFLLMCGRSLDPHAT
jgi:hypothetical protein